MASLVIDKFNWKMSLLNASKSFKNKRTWDRNYKRMWMISFSTSRDCMRKLIWQDRLLLRSSKKYRRSRRDWIKARSHSQKSQLFRIRKMRQLIIGKELKHSIILNPIMTRQSGKLILLYMPLLNNISNLKKQYISLILWKNRS